MKLADKKWLLLLAYIVACEITKDELLSEAWDRYMAGKGRVAAAAVPFLVAAHLTNALDPRFDPISLGFIGVRKIVDKVSK